ncbi:TetR family transcriptional regulator C-terminal domain-containing protein [Nocardia aurantiaca]|uniref:TetR family transcriptional regulator C-terminal domain-containing protein n=1 Tax=Nocardia aurantiaca TaxID=2675850 RepID=UPI001E2CAB17|nr:TetR family transcriptional regulator C-terminal domain-containing protein [Nocardia aurantiaca]
MNDRGQLDPGAAESRMALARKDVRLPCNEAGEFAFVKPLDRAEVAAPPLLTENSVRIAVLLPAGSIALDLDVAAVAERLTALVEGLSERWHSGSLTLDRARALLAGAIAAELGAR